MEGNPYPEKIVDEASGIEVVSIRHQIWEEGKQAGIREVMEWIKENNETRDEPWGEDYDAAYGYDPMTKGDILISGGKWQAKIKEWKVDA